MNEMSVAEAMAKGREFAAKDKDIPSVSRTLVAEVERLRMIEDTAQRMLDGYEAGILISSNGRGYIDAIRDLSDLLKRSSKQHDGDR